MTDDATLTDFLGPGPSDADDDDAREDDSDSSGSDSTQSGSDDGDPKPVESDDGTGDGDTAADTDEGATGDTGLSTYGWGEYTCRRCETETERVWREDGALVCPDCKSW